MSALRSLRFRVAAAAVVTVAVVLALAGGLVLRGEQAQRREELDALLDRRARLLIASSERLLEAAEDDPPGTLAPGFGGDLAVRVFDGGDLRLAAGAEGAAELPVPDGEGFATARVEGTTWRTRAVASDGLLIEAAAPLSLLSEGAGTARRRALRVGLLALGLTAVLGWAAGGVALRPLGRLVEAARRVTATRDLSVRVPQGDGPDEVDDLAAGLNAMLARLQESAAETAAALEASRRFAADAGHELRTPLTSMRANLDTLARNPHLPAMERAATLREVASEQARLLTLLDALQTLARGDASSGRVEPVDLAEVADAAVAEVRRRHPRTRIDLTAPAGGVRLNGSPEGLRLLLDNLLDNACRHGRDAGTVRVTVESDGRGARVQVDDDGPGIPAPDRQRVLGRFERGHNPRVPGSGLGLALVDQQARLHGGEVSITTSDLGGARLTARGLGVSAG